MRPMVALAELIGEAHVHGRADESAHRRLTHAAPAAERHSTNGAANGRRVKARRKKARSSR